MVTTNPSRPPGTDNSFARIGNIILGVWLFLSAFLWFHSPAQFNNTWLVGLGMAAIAAIGLAVPQIRWVNVALAAWLIISVWALPIASAGTFWNNLLVGIAGFFVALVPSMRVAPRRTPPRRREAHGHV